MSELRFDGRVAVVTGAGSGLGKEYALLFASRGAKVVVNDLGGDFHGRGSSQRSADLVAKEIVSKGGVAVADYNSVLNGEKIVKTAIQCFNRLDILVNNAGILRDKSFSKITDEDWDMVQNVHLKGSFKTTQAAWPYFKKQNYGRIIMTSSNSGIYGNFGQANYSAAKMGLIGLANTLAIEGSGYNIHCNVIIPTAGSRMTEDILPDVLFKELRPELIAPVVLYLCHESNEQNGSIIESAAGWAAKIHIVRGSGCLLRTSLAQSDITPESIQKEWPKILNMSNASHLSSIAEASGTLFNILEKLNQKSDTAYYDTFDFNSKDLILYALGVGATIKNPSDLKFLYENHQDFCALPTFFIMPGVLLSMSTNIVSDAIKHTEIQLTNILHGEQYIEICNRPPLDGKLETHGTIFDVMDKQSGAVVVLNCNTFDESGNIIVKNQSSVFIVGAGKFGGKKQAREGVISTLPSPKRIPDSVIYYRTSFDQAALYRLSGDLNPLHIDPSFAALAGYKTPILHGLCSLGFSVRAVLQQYGNNDPCVFKRVKVRFTKPVIPSHTLSVCMWQEGNRIHFQTAAVETKELVIVGAYVDLENVVLEEILESDEVFKKLRITLQKSGKQYAENGSFLFEIINGEEILRDWVIDLNNGIIGRGGYSFQPETRVILSDKQMLNIIYGKVNIESAYASGDVKILGDVSKAFKLINAIILPLSKL